MRHLVHVANPRALAAKQLRISVIDLHGDKAEDELSLALIDQTVLRACELDVT